jgi:4a-hydroxytetrahydrobiopterin dehydratase
LNKKGVFAMSFETITPPAGWALAANTLTRTVQFTDFIDAMIFVNTVAELAESYEHHPDIDIRYNTVTLALTTHDAGHTITAKDVQLAKAINTRLNSAE